MPVSIDLSTFSSALEQISWLAPLFAIKIFNNSLGIYVTGIVFIILVYLVSRGIMWILETQASKITSKTKNEFDNAAVDSVHRSITFILVLTAVYFVVKSLDVPESVDDFTVKAIFVLFTIKITLEVERFLALVIKNHLEPLARRQKGMMKTFIPSFLRISKFIIWAIAFLLILSNLGYNITSLIAGLGLGGLAFALAAQEALGDFFGSVTILTDQPFKVGDFVKVDTYSGTVKDVGMRSTKIQTLDKSVISVPNKKMASVIVENVSRRNMMKVEQIFGVTYKTSLRDLEKLINEIKGIIRKDPDTDNETFRVHFLEFGDSALEIKIFYYITDTSTYTHMLDIRERINLKIKRAFERMGVQMAYPSQSIYLENAKNLLKTGARSANRR